MGFKQVVNVARLAVIFRMTTYGNDPVPQGSVLQEGGSEATVERELLDLCSHVQNGNFTLTYLKC